VEELDYAFYTPDEGLSEFREAISNELARLYDNKVKSDNICVVAGANNAFFSILATIASSGDEIILLSPYYFNHYMGAKILGVKPVEIVQDLVSGTLPMDEIEKSITHRTRAIVIVNPSNPTGKSYSQEEVNLLFELCKKYNILLISDEVYNYFHSDYPKPSSVINNADWSEFSVSIHSYSKSFSLTGFRVGFITSSVEFLHQFMKTHDTNLICAPRIGQIAALEGLKNSITWVENKATIMKKRVLEFNNIFRSKQSDFSILSSGAFFIFLTFTFNTSSYEVCLRLIEKENIIMLPGSFFGPCQEKTIRLSLGNLTINEMPEVIEKIHKFSF